MNKEDFMFWARKLMGSYKPSEEVLSQLSNVDLIAIVGPTGVGKTTIIEKLGVPFVKSDVTRPKRPNEKDNHTYNFIDDYEELASQLENGEFVQFYVSDYNEFYGTHKSAYPESGKASMAIIAQLIEPFSQLGFKSLTSIYIMPPSYAEWMRRIGDMRAEELNGRIIEAKTSINYAKDHEENFHFILNDNLDLAVKDVKAIMAGEKTDERRSALATDTIDVLLRYLGEL